jgi:hypothetical protein
MKITKQHLKQLIKEELGSAIQSEEQVVEGPGADQPVTLNDLQAAVNLIMDKIETLKR